MHHRNSKSLSVESLRNIEQKTQISFEPFSANILRRVNEARGIKEKNAIFESVMNDDSAMIINTIDGYSTKILPGNKGPKTSTWEQTKQMAYELNKVGIDVVFLPEAQDQISTDSLLKIRNSYKLADFKYCVTTKANTLAMKMKHGFEQADTIVLKLVKMNNGVFKEALDYMIRNEISYGDIILINEYGKVKTISYKDISRGKYIRKTKGFL